MSYTDMTTERASVSDDPRPASVEPLQVSVVYTSGDLAREERLLAPGDELSIGRDASGLRLTDPRVSRIHLRIVWDPMVRGFRYADPGSANGTFVNGCRRERGVMAGDDVVRLGDTLLVCAMSTPPQAARMERAAKAPQPILISGETGSGKEVLARALHAASGRRGAFVAVNCATLQQDIAAAELFGHTRQAFSGASTAREGLFRAAEDGCLLLDEIGDLSLELQAALLRVLQEGAVRPVGADREQKVDVKVLAASHIDLEQAVGAGRFREDLLARLAQILWIVPALRKRRSEILQLAASFAPDLRVTCDAAEALLLWSWPRNVRELRAVVESAALLDAADGVLRLGALSTRIPLAAASVASRQAAVVPVTEATRRRQELASLLSEHQGNVAGVARALHKPRSQVYRWMSQFGLSGGKFRR